MTDFLGFIIVRAISVLFLCFPLAPALWIGRRIGDIAYFFNVKRRAIAYANIKSAFPEKDQRWIKRTLKAHYRGLGMSIAEIFKLPAFKNNAQIRNYVKIGNAGIIDKAGARGKGAILLTGHFGNWEIGPLGVKAIGRSIHVFVRDQKHKRLNDLLNRYREMTGSRVVPKGFSLREIIKALHDNGLVAIVADQDAGANGIFVNFLNRPASMAQGPVTIGLRTGASVIPCFMKREANSISHILELHEELNLINTGDKYKDLRANLQNAADIMEAHIRRFPEQWLWSHKRWKSSPQRTVLVLSDGKAGHLNQALAVAEMVEPALGSMLKARGIGEKPIVKVKVIEIKFKNIFARMLLDVSSLFASKRCQGCLRCLRFLLEKESFDKIKDQYADIIISCGASAIGANIFLKYENNAKNIAIMKPGLGRSKKNDLVILPRHDAPKIPRSNILVTDTAPNRIVPGPEAQGSKLKGIGILIGGDAKNFELKKEDVEKVISGILKISDDEGLDIFISTSRRTSPEIGNYLKEKLAGNKRCRLLVIANENNTQGVVRDILSACDIVIVSPESVSMISEAVSSGRHVVVFTGSPLKGKYAKSVASLRSGGYLKSVPPDDIYGILRSLLTEKPPVTKIEDRNAIIKKLEAII